jgi:tRNA nucleotidyltransferase (CCA-adding enzyme)
VRAAARALRAPGPGRAQRAARRSGARCRPPPLQLAGEPEWLLALLEQADAWRRPERFERWLEVWRACAAVASLPHATVVGFAARLEAAQRAGAAVHLADAELRSLRGEAIGALLRERRLQALRSLR